MHRQHAWITGGIAVACTLLVTGCAGGRAHRADKMVWDSRLGALTAQVQAQDTQLQSLGEEVAALRSRPSVSLPASPVRAVDRLVAPSPAPGAMVGARTDAAPRTLTRAEVAEMQRALGNAGFDPGPVDGALGRRTRRALRQFQQANRLQVDGKVGTQTLAALQQYLSPGTSWRK